MPELLQWVTERIPPAMQYPELCVVAIEYENQVYGVAEAVDLPTQMAHGLYIGGEIMGRIYIAYTKKQDFLNEESALLGGIASRLSGYIENRRLYEQTEATLAQTEALYAGSERVIRATTMDVILQALVDSTALQRLDLAQLLFFDRPWDDEPPELINLASVWSRRGEPRSGPAGTKYPLAEFPTSQYLDRDEPIVFPDLDTDERIETHTRAFFLEQLGIRGLVEFPLVAGGQWIGLLHVEAYTVLALSQDEIRQISSLTDLAASVIQNQRLFEETRQALAEVEVTQRRYTVQAWEAYRGRSAALSYEQVREDVPPLGDEILPEVGQAVAQKKSLAKSSTSAFSASGDDAQVPFPEGQSSLIVPLTVRDEVVGVLGLQETDEERHWTPEETALVEAIGEQLTQAAENLRLFDETQQRAALEKRVGEIGDRIRAAQSLEEALQVAIKEVGLSLKAPQTTVQLEVK